jgi:hypothetical protein
LAQSGKTRTSTLANVPAIAESYLPRPCAIRASQSSKNSKANPIETGERSGGIGEICLVEVDEK